MILHKIITKNIPPFLYGGMSGCDLDLKGEVTSIKNLEQFPWAIWACWRIDSNWKQWFIPPVEIVTREHRNCPKPWKLHRKAWSGMLNISFQMLVNMCVQMLCTCLHTCGAQRSPSRAPQEWPVLFCETGSLIGVEFTNLARLPHTRFFLLAHEPSSKSWHRFTALSDQPSLVMFLANSSYLN